MSGHSQASASGRLRAARGCLLSTLLGHTPEVTDGPLRRETGRQSRLSNGRVRPTADVCIVRMKLQRDLFTVADQCIVQLVLERAKADLDRVAGKALDTTPDEFRTTRVSSVVCVENFHIAPHTRCYFERATA